MLTQEQLKSLLAYDQHTGEFISRVRRGNKRAAGQVEGRPHCDGYVAISLWGKRYLAHRLAFLYMERYIPEEVDDINGDRSDTRWSNLRACTRTDNMRNLGGAKRTNRTTGLLGAHLIKHTGKYAAQITVNRKCIHLGSFDTPELAHAAYLKAKHELHPTHQRLR